MRHDPSRITDGVRDEPGSRRRSSRPAPSRAGGLAAAFVALAASFAVGARPASAGVGLAITSELPAAVTIGAIGVAASLNVANQASGGEAGNSATLTDITLVPSCGLSPAAPPDWRCTGGEDPALRLSPSGAGVSGSACAGQTFTITEIDPTSGRYRFTAGQPVVLGPPGSAIDNCTINFTFDVSRALVRDAFPAQAGMQTTQVAFSAATFSPSGLTGSGTGTDVTTVDKAVPTLGTRAPAKATVGQAISDVAILAGGTAPTGVVTFTLFGPGDEACAGPALSTTTVPVNGAGEYASPPYSPSAAGTYRWVAAYGGDASNARVATSCAAPGSVTEVDVAAPTLTVSAPGSTPAGVPITGVAVLTGGSAPSGEVTFRMFAPGDEACTGQPVSTSTRPVTGNGEYTSDPFPPTEPGTYRWMVTYGGDGANAGVTTACAAATTEVVRVAAPGTTSPTTAAPQVANVIVNRAPDGRLAETGSSATRLAMLGGLLIAIGAAMLIGHRRPARQARMRG